MRRFQLQPVTYSRNTAAVAIACRLRTRRKNVEHEPGNASAELRYWSSSTGRGGGGTSSSRRSWRIAPGRAFMLCAAAKAGGRAGSRGGPGGGQDPDGHRRSSRAEAGRAHHRGDRSLGGARRHAGRCRRRRRHGHASSGRRGQLGPRQARYWRPSTDRSRRSRRRSSQRRCRWRAPTRRWPRTNSNEPGAGVARLRLQGRHRPQAGGARRANARVRVAQAHLNATRADRPARRPRAASGLILSRNVELGQVVSPGSGALFRLAGAAKMEMRAQLSQQDLASSVPVRRLSDPDRSIDRSFSGRSGRSLR